MGNTQSAEAPRRPPTKLTKPRTNTSTSNLLAISSEPSRRSSTMSLSTMRNNHPSTVSLAKATTDGDESALKKTARNRTNRRSLFRSKSAQPEHLVPAEEPLSDFEVTLTSNPLHRYSSMTSIRAKSLGEPDIGSSSSRPPIRNSRSAQTYFPQASQPVRLSLVIEAQSPEPIPEEEMKQLGIRHASFDDGTQDTPISPIERSESHDSMPIPIRRRSLLTPGIATRKDSREKIVRKSLPAQASFEIGGTEYGNVNDKRKFRRTLPAQTTLSQDLLKKYYDQSKPTSSSLEEIAAIEAPRFFDMEPRTVTPSDLEYSHIGAFKLGSLRITNGTVSPEPLQPDPSYFDNKKESQSDAEALHSDLSQKGGNVMSDNIFDEMTGTFVDAKKSQVRFEFLEVSEAPPRIVQTMVEIPTSSLGLADFLPTASQGQDVVAQSPATAFELAQAYMQEIAASPFSFEESAPQSPRFEVTSKPTEIEDNLFDDESGSPLSLTTPIHINSSHWSSERHSPALLNTTSAVKPSNSAKSSQKAFHDLEQQQPLKPLQKADSGYSSKTSLRSLGSRRSLPESGARVDLTTMPALAQVAPPIPSKSPPPTPPKDLHAKDFATTDFQGSKASETDYGPPIPPKDRLLPHCLGMSEMPNSLPVPKGLDHTWNNALSQPPSRQAPPVPVKQTPSNWRSSTKPPPLPVKSIEQTQAAARLSTVTPYPSMPPLNRRQSTPLPAYEQTMRPGLKPSTSDTSISTISRRLQKRSPSPKVDVVVQGFTEIEPARVPPVSSEISEHLEERLKNFPTLTHTYKSVQRTNSKETLATIFSMASAEQQAEEGHAFSRFRGLKPRAPSNDDVERSMSVEPLPDDSPPVQRFSLMPKILRKSAERRSRRRSLESASRERSSSRGTQDQEMYAAALVAASTNLVLNPHDTTAPVLFPISGNRPNDIPASSKHGIASRGRTMGMDSISAAQFARDRSISLENERRRSLRRQSYEGRNSSEERSRFLADSAPPLPHKDNGNNQDYFIVKKTKSPPPVSMKVPRKRMSSPPPKPSRKAPAAPIDIPKLPDMGYPLDSRANEVPDVPQQQKTQVLHGGIQAARETLSNARQSINATRSENGRPLEQRRGRSSLPIGRRSSFEQQSRPLEQIQSRTPSQGQDRRRSLNRQPLDSSQARRNESGLARASFDLSIEQNTRHAHPLSQSHSYTQMRSEPINIDRYNNGFAYGYEPGYGVGGSAGTRNGDTTASRKGVPGSLNWGVDLSDVPIMVMQRNDGLKA